MALIRMTSKQVIRKHTVQHKKEDQFYNSYILGKQIGEGNHSNVYKCFRKDDI